MPRCALALAIVSLSSTAALARGEDRNVPDFNAVNVASGIRATVEIGRASCRERVFITV